MVNESKRIGTIKKYLGEKRFGFIRPQDGTDDIFFHFNAWQEDCAIEEGKKVSFIVTKGPKGAYAENIKLVD